MSSSQAPNSNPRRAVQATVLLLFVAGIVMLLTLIPRKAQAPAEPEGEKSIDGRVLENREASAETTPEEGTGREPEYISVVGSVPLPSDRLKNRITVFFSEDLKEEGLNEPGATAPFTTTPPFQGTFTVAKNYLDIRSDTFPITEPVRLELGDAIESVTGKKLDPEQRSLVFAAFGFEVRRLWLIDSTPEREVVGILFSTPVSSETLQSHLTVTTADGTAVPFELRTRDDDDITRMILSPNTEWPVTISISKGLKDASGEFELATDYSTQYPPKLSLQLQKVAWGELGELEQRVILSFSRAVLAEDLEAYLTIRRESDREALEYDVVEANADGSVVVAVQHADPVNEGLIIELKEGLTGAEHSTMDWPTKQVLMARSRLPQPELRVEDQWWNWAGRDGLSLQLGFNAAVKAPSLKQYLKVEPEVANLRIEPGYRASRLMVYGDFDSNSTYRFHLGEGMPYGDGAKLKKAYSFSAMTEQVPDYIGFAHEGKYYFPRRGGLALPLETRNVSKTKLSLYRMFPSNIAVAIRDMNEGKPWMEFLDTWSEYLTSTEMDVKVVKDRVVSTPLALDQNFPENKYGVFCLAAYDISPPERNESKDEDASEYEGEYEHAEGRYPEATKLVLFTNIGLLSHWLDDSLVVFAHDLYTLEPKPLATVTVYSKKNQVMGTSNTDERGMSQLGPFDKRLGLPSVVVVEAGDDYTFLELQPRTDDTREISPDMPRFDRKAYDAFLYADRDLYRPGEPVHLRWLVRTNYGDALPNVPLTYTVVKPNGQDLTKGPTTLSALGTGGLDLATQKDYPTGKYIVNLKVPGDRRAIGTYTFNLEEFVPNRMKAAVKVSEPRWFSGEKYTIELNAQELYGAPAKERKSEVKVILKPARFSPEKWRIYTFGNDTPFKTEVVSSGEEQTDALGTAKFTFTYTAPSTVTFPLNALVLGQVYEVGGRAVSGTTETTLFPSQVCLGIAATSAQDRSGVDVNVAAINADETPAALDTVKVTLEKQVWSYYVRRYYNYHEPNWSETFEPVETRDVTLTGGTGSTSFTLGGYGYYRVRVHSDATPQFSTLSFYSYGGEPHLVDAARPSLIKLTLDKAKYVVGDEATVRIEAPFDGKGFIVLQGEEIQRIESVDIKDGVGIARFLLGREQCPNVWIEATVVHAIKEGQNQVYPFSSFALASIVVDDPRRSIALSFPGLPEEVRPSSEVQFTVEARDASGNPAVCEVTLAAVDEGIHSITGYQSPDPVKYFSRQRRPDYRRTHYYDKVAYDFEKTQIGGDLEALLGKRASAVDENWIRPVALWSGVVNTDASGRAVVSMTLPEYYGQLRLVAVGATSDSTGAQTGYVYVRRPYMLRTSMPRFLLPGDKATMRATLVNNTDVAAKVSVNWTAEGTLAGNTGTQEIDVPAKGDASVLADFTAGDAIGQGTIRWYAVFKDAAGNTLENLAETAPLPVRAPAAFQSHHELIVLQPGESTTAKNTKFVDDVRAEVEILASASPLVRVQDALRYVVQYPYGCVEQTTSRLMPMYLLQKQSALTSMHLQSEQKIEGFIQMGIGRIFSMQTDSGGLGFWPGAYDPYPYGSVYALHFLTLVKNGREFELPEENFAALQSYVEQLAKDWSKDDPSASYLRAYATYVLALGGDTEAIKQIERFDNVKLPRAARYLLAAAIAQNTQDRDRVSLYLSIAPSEPFDVREPDGTLNSEIRSTAVELLALVQMQGDPKAMSEKADLLTDYLANRRYGTTQETAFIISALASYMDLLKTNVEAASATIDGSQGPGSVKGVDHYVGRHHGPGGSFVVTNTGATAIYVSVTTRGVPATTDPNAVAEGIHVQRTFHTPKGEPHNPSQFAQTESYVVMLELKVDRHAKNLVVADLIPAGFEIENPRLEADALPAGAFKDPVTPSFLEIRDDRLVAAFDALAPDTYKFYYVVRAVTPGQYQYPAVVAECMYDASIHGRSAPSAIDISPR
ncbi:MAG: membrane protein [Candidatus Hydrogenedentota bacterium]